MTSLESMIQQVKVMYLPELISKGYVSLEQKNPGSLPGFLDLNSNLLVITDVPSQSTLGPQPLHC